MNKIFTQVILAAAVTAGLAYSQVPKGQGYVLQGFGQSTSGRDGLGHTAAGGEYAFFKGISAGAEVGALYPWRYTLEGVLGVVNVNGGYHFTAGKENTKWDPFVSAGYTLFFRGGTANGYNYGGGVVYWVKPRLGIRAEVRDHRFREARYGNPEFRIGLSFR